MRKIDVAELVPGMVVAENIISFSNQLIYPAGYRLTDKAITKLTFYSVPFVCVEDESDHFTYSEMKSYSERVRSTPEFQHFAEEFEKDVYKFKNFLNDVVEKNAPLDIHDILQDTLALLHNSTNNIHILESNTSTCLMYSNAMIISSGTASCYRMSLVTILSIKSNILSICIVDCNRTS